MARKWALAEATDARRVTLEDEFDDVEDAAVAAVGRLREDTADC